MRVNAFLTFFSQFFSSDFSGPFVARFFYYTYLLILDKIFYKKIYNARIRACVLYIKEKARHCLTYHIYMMIFINLLT